MRPIYTAALAAISAFALTAHAQPAPGAAPSLEEAHPELMAEIEASQVMRRFGIESATAKPDGAVRIATYNILNLFDDVDDPALSGERHEDIDDTKALHERLAVAKAIRDLDADVLALQEIESLDALIWFKDEFLAGMGYDHVASIDAGDARGIEQAVLSRHPILHTENWPQKPLGGIHPDNYGPRAKNWYAGQPINFHRSPLRVDINLGADTDPQPLTLFVVHHKSGRYSGYWREAEARGAVELLARLAQDHPDRPVIVLGDFNALPTDTSVKTYLDAGLDDIFANRKQTSEIVTHESGRRIDLILANKPAMAHLLANQAFVLGTPARPQGINWRDLPTFPGLASDHYPVAVDMKHPTDSLQDDPRANSHAP